MLSSNPIYTILCTFTEELSASTISMSLGFSMNKYAYVNLTNTNNKLEDKTL